MLPADSLFEPHQIAGSEFIAARKICILADDPRLGKSRQVIRAMRKVYGSKIPNALIVAPAGARLDWKREFQEVCPPLAEKFYTLSADMPPQPHGINLCSYNYTLNNFDLLNRLWDMLIIDEAHYLMNREAERTKVMYGEFCKDGGIVANADRVVLLSATLQPKDPSDLWTHLRRLFPGLIRTARGPIADYWKFFFTFCSAVKYYRNARDAEAENGRFEWRVTGGRNLSALNQKLSAVMLRRTFKEVYGDKIVIRCVDLPITGPAPAIENDFDDGDREAIIDGTEEPETYAEWLHEVGREKVAGVVDYVRQRLDDDESLKLIIFAWHRDVMMDYVTSLVKYGVAYLPGGLNDKERAEQREKLKTGARVCVAQMAAAGEGIDLSAADECILAEPSAVPKSNWQCGNRMVNLKKRGVLLVRLAMLEGSIDRERQKTCIRRMRDIDAVFNPGE